MDSPYGESMDLREEIEMNVELEKTRSKIEAIESKIEAVELVLNSFRSNETNEKMEISQDDPYGFYKSFTVEELKGHFEQLQEEKRQLRESALQPQGDFLQSQFAQLSTLKSQHFRMIRSGDYLHVELPHIFQNRYGSGPDKIYIRPCYKDLYDIVSGTMIEKQTPLPVFLFTGVPGIGKSVFLVYLLFRFLNDERFPDKRFLLEFAPRDYDYFVPTEEEVEDGMYKFTYSKLLPSQFEILWTTPIFSGIKDFCEPYSHGKWLFIFSSPDSRRYKQKLKGDHYKYTLPTWSRSELLCLEEDEEQWIDRFDLFGGVPSIVFRRPVQSDLEAELDILRTEGPLIADGVFKFGFGVPDSDVNYMLLHINPPESGDSWDYRRSAVWTFASDKMFVKFAEIHRNALLAQACELFNAGASWVTRSGSSAGHLFEKVCLWLIPLAGSTITVRSFANLDDPPIDIVLPERGLLDHLWKQKANEGDKLQPNILYQPRTSDLESGCAFCWLPAGVSGDGASTLVVLQITVGEVHPVKVNGLEDIVSAFPEHSIKRKLLVFVTPHNGKLGSAQPLLTHKYEVARAIPVSVQGLEQYVCRRMLHDTGLGVRSGMRR